MGRPRGADVGVVIVAAGVGVRLGAGIPKAFVTVAGRPLLSYAVAAALDCPDTAYLVVVAPGEQVADAAHVVMPAADSRGVPAGVVAGGAERGDSVLAGVHAVPDGLDIVVIHDAARAFAPPAIFVDVAAAVRAGHPAVVPGEAVVDTIKTVDGDGLVSGTPDRRALRAIQTPQGFERAVLMRAHERGSSATDDAALVERLGLPVLVVNGSPDAFKVTTSQDLHRAEWLIAQGALPASIDRDGTMGR